MNASRKSGFVVGGWARARAACALQIRTEVTSQYASRLATASIIQRWRLKREMNKQIAQQVAKIAPPGALY